MANKNYFFVLLFLAMVAWGGSWVNVKVLSGYINAYEMVLFRFSMTALSMVPIILYLKKSFAIDMRSLGLVLVTSVALIAYMNYFFIGTKYGTASLGGAMVTSLIPINTFIILVLMRARKVSRKHVFALFIGAIGVLTMLHVWALDLGKVMVIQNLYFLIAALLWPVVTILSSKSRKISPIVFTFYLYVCTVVLDWFFFVDINNIPFSTFDGIFWLNIVLITFAATTFANTIYFLGIETLGAGEVSSFIFLVPFSAIILSALFLKETVDAYMVAGTIMTLFAVKILNNITFFKPKNG